MKAFHNQKYHDRSERPHLSPGIMQQLESGKATRRSRSTGRTYADFVRADMLIVDFDGNEATGHKDAVTKEQAISYFNQNKAKGLAKCSFVICSTHSTEGGNPFKFRMFFMLKRPATTIEEYKACYRFIDETLAKHGHGYAPFNGLDTNSQSPVQLYNVPGTNADNEDHAFFETVNLKESRDLSRYGLDPAELLEKYRPAPTIEYKGTIGQLKPKHDFDLEAVKREYTALVDGRCLGLKILGKRCATTGAMAYNDVEQVLLSVIDRDDSEQLKRVSDTMTQLAGEVRWWGMVA